MRIIIGIGLLLIPCAALAQSAAPAAADYNSQALSQRYMQELNNSIQWQARALADEDQLKALQKQIDDEKKAPAPATAPPAADPPK
jgi:hypothetical protein